MKYVLTDAAKRDIRNISKYTLKNYGVKQEQAYIAMLYAQFEAIARIPSISNQSYMSQTQIDLGLKKISAVLCFIAMWVNVWARSLEYIET